MTARILLVFGALGASAQVVQNNYFSESSTEPGGFAVSSTDLLQTSLLSATRTGSAGSGNTYFYREDSGYTVDLTRLFDGGFGTFGSTGLGHDGNYTVMPNNVSITFTFDTSVNTSGYTLTGIRTFASWDDGRDGQAYQVQYATASDPTNFLSLHTVATFNPTVLDESATLVVLTGASGDLATNVAAVRFVFTGFENGGTAYREFDVIGAASAVPEPSTYAALAGVLALGAAGWSRRRRGASLK